MTILSPEAGIFTVTAVLSTNVNGVPLYREQVAVVTYVDADITVEPVSASRGINEPQVFTINVKVNDGSGWSTRNVTPTVTVQNGTLSYTSDCEAGT